MIGDETPSCCGLHAQTLVHSSRGLTEIAVLTADDTIFGFNEASKTLSPVRAGPVGTTGTGRLIEIGVMTRTVRATADVWFFALVDRRQPGRIRRRFREEWVRAGDLKVGDIIAIARKTPDAGSVQELPLVTTPRDRRARAVAMPAHADEDLMWWTGLYAGDGYVHHSGRRGRVEFAVPASQPDVRAELIRVSRRLFAVEARAKDEWRIVVPGIRIVDYVQAIGLGGKALEKRIPPWVFASPEDQRLAFLGGYIDADGDVRSTRANKDIGLTSANPALLEDARRLAVQCGVRTSRVWAFRSRHPVETDRWMTGYRMRFSGDFDRIACRSERRRARMHRRKFFHTGNAPGRTTVRSHTSVWIGFTPVESIADGGEGVCWGLNGASGPFVVEGVILRLR